MNVDKLIDFLQKEVPKNAIDLNNAINSTLGIIKGTRSALQNSISELLQLDKHNEIGNFLNADRQLMDMGNYLRSIVEDSEKKINSTPVEKEVLMEPVSDNKIDYSACKVDKNESHNLDEDFTNKKLAAFSLDGKKYSVRNWNRLLVMVCEILNKKNSKLFQSFPDDETMQGRTRVYFSRTPMKYACKKVSGTDIYVLTNNNGNGNCSIIIRMLEKYDIPTTSFEIFLRADYSSLHENEEDNTKKKLEDEEVFVSKYEKKIGEYARDWFKVYFSSLGKTYDLKNFLNRDWCHNNLGICYPLLKEVDMTIPIEEQKNYNNEYARYWTKPILEINGNHYIICSQWFKEFQEKLDKWIEEENKKEDTRYEQQSIFENSHLKDKEDCEYYDFKKDECMCVDSVVFTQSCSSPNSCPDFMPFALHVVPKQYYKKHYCPYCFGKTEKEIIYCTYRPNDVTEIHNKLISYRCERCEKNYISDTVFDGYTRSKNLDDLNVKFIKDEL